MVDKKRNKKKSHKTLLANNVVFVMNLPFSKIPNFSGGKISERLIKRLLRIKLH